MKFLEKLAELADKLDKMQLTKEADQVDKILKEAFDWPWGSDKKAQCTCNCSQCQYAKDLIGRPQIQVKHHMQCLNSNCEIKRMQSGAKE